MFRYLRLTGVSAIVALGCASGSAPVVPPVAPGAGDRAVIPTDHEADFVVPEYLVEGTAEFALDPADAALGTSERREAALHLVPLVQVAVAWFLQSALAPKDAVGSDTPDGAFDALTRGISDEDLELQERETGTFTVRFQQKLVGTVDLLTRLGATPGPDGTLAFDLIMGRVPNASLRQLSPGNEWYRQEPWLHFDPTTLPPEQLQKLPLSITPEPPSVDAWPDYARLVADGRLEIDVHFGWDPATGLGRLEAARLFDALVEKGYQPPVGTAEAYDRTSGPLTRTITVGGQPVQVAIRMFWPHSGGATDPATVAGAQQLEADLVRSLEQSEVVVFTGHFGPFPGFAIADDGMTGDGALDEHEIALLDLPQTYQVLMVDGGDAYALGRAFFSHPAKSARTNLDIVTVTTYTESDTGRARQLVESLTATTFNGHHVPWTYLDLLHGLPWKPWEPAVFAVQGMNDNPHLCPWADTSTFCTPCTTSGECGAEGNRCVTFPTDGRFCSARCTADDGCPTGYTCAAVSIGANVQERACVPRDYTCGGTEPAAPGVLINEILADPRSDANGDGHYDWLQDEFVELVNAGTESVDLSGWTISDSVKVRFTFPAGSHLASGGAAVVFGGGKTAAFHNLGTASVFASTAPLKLTRNGDAVLLRDADGHVTALVVFGAEASHGRSLVRATDGDPSAPMVLHPGDEPFSPGFRSDGSPL